ncbi:hypothetical protein RDWZM_008567 [Blomia tropicalis]|uniref:MACPF domain-containing protein n=1 Tax=Blomia tropicalis TaxID=40697 RepID=A0A9Q0M187_BLOTA|nr:hypothetical protein RDWZM_008567 [Blomia tropicalis]
MDFKPHTSLTPNDNFNQFVTNQLTGKYNDMPEKYQEFLDTFGTHYFESGIFGGYLLQQTVINDNYRYTTRDSEINANLNAKYQSLVNGHFDVDNNSNNRTAIFNQNTQTSRFFYGGQTNLLTNMDEKQFALWAASVPNDPWLFGGKIMPIETLISCEKVKAEVKSAVVIKRHKAYLQELKETLMLVSKTIPRAFNDMNKITELLKQTDPKEADIEQMAHMVQEYVADAQAVKDRYQMKHYVDELSKLQSYELFCKQEVALKCDKEKKHDIEEAVAEVTHLQTSMANMIVSQSRPDTEQVRLLVARSNELVKYHQTTPMSDCREKLICKMCKSALINITDKETCNTEHIKKLVQVHT